MADLKLGPLPKQSTVKVTVLLSELLKEELDAYAAEHSRLYEPVETTALIPHMLEAFLRADRAWCRRRKQRGQGQTGRRRVGSPSDANVNDRMREGDFLVTPVEKCGIVLDDAPFMAVELRVGEGNAGRELRFRTNMDEWVTCGPSHPLRFETEAATGGLKPYVHVRADLWAKTTRAVWLELAELGEVREIAGTEMFGVVSAREFYAMAPASSFESMGL